MKSSKSDHFRTSRVWRSCTAKGKPKAEDLRGEKKNHYKRPDNGNNITEFLMDMLMGKIYLFSGNTLAI